MDSRIYWIWLQQALPLGSPSIGPLLDTFGHAMAVYEANEAALAAAGIRGSLRRRLSDKDLTTAHRICDRMLSQGDWLLTPEDALYPMSLRQIPGYPVALYGRGTMPDLDNTPAITVVGTRRVTPQGVHEAHALAAGLAAGGMVVVSGGATGIDAAVHAGAITGGGITLVVMACPVDENYPAPNTALRRQVLATGGVLVSEYPSGEPYRCDFHVRNRLLVGLGHSVCLAQTPSRSGARITARLAREQGRDVYAMPGTLAGHHYDGAHKEIQMGATLVMRATDILQDFTLPFPGRLDLEAAEQAQQQAEKQPLPALLTQEGPTPPTGVKTDHASPKKKKVKPVKQPLPAEENTPPATAVCPGEVSTDAAAVFAVLTAESQPVDLLADLTGLPMPRLLVALTELEMDGCAAHAAGQRYKRVYVSD